MTAAATGASKEAIGFHYDLSRDFYKLWLDDGMTYSSALFEPGDDLAQAQQRKLDFHIDNVALGTDDRLLDIGCGWGGLIQRALARHPLKKAVGLTLSEDQKSHIEELADGRIEVRLEDWRNHKPEGTYKGIVSIGAMEHFAEPGLTADQRIGIYREFFNSCRHWLTPGGCLSLQTIAFDKMNEFTVSKFMTSHIFPESMCPSPHELLKAADGILSLELMHNHADHYARTCRIWSENIESCYDEAALMVGESKVDDYLRYLKMSASSFSKRGLMLLRLRLRSYRD
jgi:cyclopropane-fatty-acyl-phospholipid synthase